MSSIGNTSNLTLTKPKPNYPSAPYRYIEYKTIDDEPYIYQVGYMVKGNPVGIWRTYAPEGYLLEETDYRDLPVHRRYELHFNIKEETRKYNDKGQLTSKTTFYEYSVRAFDFSDTENYSYNEEGKIHSIIKNKFVDGNMTDNKLYFFDYKKNTIKIVTKSSVGKNYTTEFVNIVE